MMKLASTENNFKSDCIHACEIDSRVKVMAVINDILLGGAQSVVLNIGSLINKTKFKFTVCHINDYPLGVRKNFRNQFDSADIPVTNLGKNKKPYLLVSFFRLFRHIRKERPDILHCCLPDAVILGVFAGRLAGVNKIIIHEMNTHKFYSKKLEFFFKIARYFSSLTITYEESLETELFGSSEVLSKPVRTLHRMSYTIYNGVDLEKVDETVRSIPFQVKRSELGIPSEKVLIFSAARLIDWKGFEHLLRALPKVMVSCKDFILLIAGEGEQEYFLRGLINELGISEVARLLGPRTDVYEILTVSDIYPQAYAYPPGFSSISISMSAMEAMAFSIPVVVSRYPALYSNIKHQKNAYVVEPRNVDQIADALIFLINNKQERNRIGRNGRTFVDENFSSRKIILIYESVFWALYSA